MQCITDGVEDWSIMNVNCNICNGFLSVKPILINIQNGTNICGRCITKSTTVQHNHLFEILARQFTFPCTFASEGCSVTQLFEEIGSHEKSCTYRISKCYCSWSGNAFDFIKHCEGQHNQMVIQDGDTFSLQNQQTCLILKCHGLFFIVNCFTENHVLQVHIAGVTNTSRECNATFQFTQFGFNETTKIVLDKVKNLNCRELSGLFSLKAKISDEFQNSINKSIKCPNCLVQMAPPILRCSNGHLTCVECTGAWLNNCKICDIECEFTCDSELQCIALATPYYCKWSCGNKLSYNKIRDHEQGCEKRIYNCWRSGDCSWSGNLNELILHEADCLIPLIGTDQSCLFTVNKPEVSFLGTININERLMYYLIVFNCCFNVTFDRMNGINSLYFNHYDIHGFGCFRFVAELTHTEVVDCPLNKTYDLNHIYGGIYKADIPEEDILKFGGSESYKITARVILLHEEERKIRTNNMYERFKNYSML